MEKWQKKIYELVGTNIRRIRKEKGMTGQKLADEIDIEKSNLPPIEKGRINTTLNTLYMLAKALDVGVIEFFQIMN